MKFMTCTKGKKEENLIKNIQVTNIILFSFFFSDECMPVCFVKYVSSNGF